jgi:hypothetical protein
LGARSALVACHDAFERRVIVCQCCEKHVHIRIRRDLMS